MSNSQWGPRRCWLQPGSRWLQGRKWRTPRRTSHPLWSLDPGSPGGWRLWEDRATTEEYTGWTLNPNSKPANVWRKTRAPTDCGNRRILWALCFLSRWSFLWSSWRWLPAGWTGGQSEPEAQRDRETWGATLHLERVTDCNSHRANAPFTFCWYNLLTLH